MENVTFDPKARGGDNNREVELKQPGKDSMVFQQLIDLGDVRFNDPSNGGRMGHQVYENLQEFCANKERTESVLDAINPTRLNAHLHTLMDGLTATVFRAYNSSITFQTKLRNHEASPRWGTLTLAEKLEEYNSAHRQWPFCATTNER